MRIPIDDGEVAEDTPRIPSNSRDFRGARSTRETTARGYVTYVALLLVP